MINQVYTDNDAVIVDSQTQHQALDLVSNPQQS